MSAIDTASRVIRWAISGHGPPPQGDLRAAEQLAAPPAELRQALGTLAAVTAAKLRWGDPPLGRPSSVGLDGMLLAAGLGIVRIPEAFSAILAALPAPVTPWDWAARHALAFPALPYLPDACADECRRISPLTALLDRPAPGQLDPALKFAEQLLVEPRARLSLELHLATPATQPAVRRWRRQWLDRWRLGQPPLRNFVLNVYEAAMVYHQTEMLAQIQAALNVINNPRAAADEARLQDALSIAQWWEPLAALARTELDALRARRYLGYAYRRGIDLTRLAQRLTRGAA